MQFRCDPVAGSRHRSTIAVAVAGAVIGTDTSESRDVWLQTPPCVERVGQSRVQDDCWSPYSGAVEVEPKLASTNELAWATKALGVRAPPDSLVGGTGEGDQQQQR
jgi:hypothetical protein